MAMSYGVGRRLVAGLSAGALVATAAASLAPAATLDDQTCDQLKREIVQLEGLGTRDALQKGAQWGRANLNAAKLEQVKKLIEMDEAVAFRCPRPKPQPDPQKQAKAGAKSAVKAPVAEGGRAAQDILKPKPQPRPKAQAAVDGQKADASKDAPRAAPPKPKPRPPVPKPTDAYSPPKAPPPQ